MARANGDVRQLNPMMNPGVALITEALLGLVVPLVFIAFLDPRLLFAPLLYNDLDPVGAQGVSRQGIGGQGIVAQGGSAARVERGVADGICDGRPRG
jgi:hypothetical protein